ncbi:MAG: serine hydrolase domain-containing protein [Chitinophagaceae bacterium]
MRYFYKSCITLISVGLMQPAIAQHNDFSAIHTKVDSFISLQMTQKNIAGLSLAVMREGKIIHSKGYGYANLEHKIPADTNTVYLMASITKTFVAVATMILVEEGKISLTDTIGKHVRGLPAHWNVVTIQQLLSHTSGIKGSVDWPPPCKMELKYDNYNYTTADVIKETACLPLSFIPGEKWEYSGRGYFVLGMLIEAVSGKTFEEFLKEKIFDPLQMNNTKMINYKAIIPNRATGYQKENNHFVNKIIPQDPVVEFSDGGLISTVIDMSKWDEALYSEKFLKKETLQLMFTPVKIKDGLAPYGLGFGTTPYQAHRRVGHIGRIPGFESALTRFLDDKISVVIFINTELNEGQMDMANRIASFYFDSD